VRQQIEAHATAAMQLRGQVAMIEAEITSMRKHVSVLEELLKGAQDGLAC